MKKLIVGGLLALMGCAASEVKPDPAAIEEKINTFAALRYYSIGIGHMGEKDYLMARECFNLAIEKDDSPLYRFLRYRSNMHLAMKNPGKHFPLEAIVDAEAYIRQLPYEPDGYAAKALALVRISDDNQFEAATLLERAFGFGKEFRFFREKSLREMYGQLYENLERDTY